MYFQPSTQTVFTHHHDIRVAFPNVSFPAVISDETLAEFGVFPLTTGHDFGPVAQAALDEQAALTVQLRKQAILAELSAIDAKSIRALREGNASRIAELETQAQALRTELAAL